MKLNIANKGSLAPVSRTGYTTTNARSLILTKSPCSEGISYEVEGDLDTVKILTAL